MARASTYQRTARFYAVLREPRLNSPFGKNVHHCNNWLIILHLHNEQNKKNAIWKKCQKSFRKSKHRRIKKNNLSILRIWFMIIHISKVYVFGFKDFVLSLRWMNGSWIALIYFHLDVVLVLDAYVGIVIYWFFARHQLQEKSFCHCTVRKRATIPRLDNTRMFRGFFHCQYSRIWKLAQGILSTDKSSPVWKNGDKKKVEKNICKFVPPESNHLFCVLHTSVIHSPLLRLMFTCYMHTYVYTSFRIP